MRKQIIRNYIVILVALSLITGGSAYYFIRSAHLKGKIAHNETSVKLIEKDLADRLSAAPNGRLPSLFRLAQEYARLTGSRIIFLSEDGRPLADSLNNDIIFEDFGRLPVIVSAMRDLPDLYKTRAPEIGANEFYYYARRISLPNGECYILCIGDYADEIDRAIDDFLTYLALSTLIGLAVASVLSVVTSEKIVRPLEKITEAAKMISSGHIRQYIPVESEDEIAELAESFNTMSAELQRSIEQMREVDELRRNFVANASHELKTPLTAILGFVETLKNHDLPPNQRAKALEVIESESRRLQEMIAKLLVLSKIESDRSVRPELFRFADLLDEVVDLMLPLAEDRSVRIIKPDPAAQIDLLSDPELLKIVLVNLIDNAVKYNVENGEVRIDVQESADELSIRVADTGVGIPEKDLEHIFERFYRVDSTRSRSAGSGLGLSICKHILMGLRGDIEVRSTKKEGTVFTVHLPRVHRPYY